MNRIILVLVLVIYRPGLILAFILSPSFSFPFQVFQPPPSRQSTVAPTVSLTPFDG